MDIEIGARVRTRDDADVGEVHRVVVDLEAQTVASIVVLKGHLLSRDILVPLEYVERADEDGVVLSLRADELEGLSDFAYNEILSPPPTWAFPMPYPGGTAYIPAHQRERLGGSEIDLVPDTKVLARDAELGTIDRIELVEHSGRVDAFWVRTGGLLGHDLRIPAEWVEGVDGDGVFLAATRAEVEAQLGPESRARAEARGSDA